MEALVIVMALAVLIPVPMGFAAFGIVLAFVTVAMLAGALLLGDSIDRDMEKHGMSYEDFE